ncbi:hypothetical protein BJV78DRAFT_1351119 [Lactifluus subvellereus]|nr:hypothetical protein BJV78DRAFT_1351119 [Lactifluus subvellereus]
MSFNETPGGEAYSTAEASSRYSLQAQYISPSTVNNESHLVARGFLYPHGPQQCPSKIKCPPLRAIHTHPLAPNSARNARDYSPVGGSGTDTSGCTSRTGFIAHHRVAPGEAIVPTSSKSVGKINTETKGQLLTSSEVDHPRVMSVDDAATYARSLVEARSWELGKQGVWEDSQDRRMPHSQGASRDVIVKAAVRVTNPRQHGFGAMVKNPCPKVNETHGAVEMLKDCYPYATHDWQWVASILAQTKEIGAVAPFDPVVTPIPWEHYTRDKRIFVPELKVLQPQEFPES